MARTCWRSRARIRDVRPDLFGGSSAAARLLQLRYTEPSSATKLEADGSRFTFTIETRDHKVQRDENKSTVRRCRLRYELVDAGADAPRIAGFASIGAARRGSRCTTRRSMTRRRVRGSD
jgi:hypothetical protein